MIFLNYGSTGPEGHKTPLYFRDNYEIQEKIQYYALITCVICIPVMLLIKPTIEFLRLPKEDEEAEKDFLSNLHNFKSLQEMNDVSEKEEKEGKLWGEGENNIYNNENEFNINTSHNINDNDGSFENNLTENYYLLL